MAKEPPMTDEAKALVERLRGGWNGWTTLTESEAADLIETQAREIEQMREALVEIMERGGAFGGIWCALAAQEALAGDSHDQ